MSTLSLNQQTKGNTMKTIEEQITEVIANSDLRGMPMEDCQVVAGLMLALPCMKAAKEAMESHNVFAGFKMNVANESAIMEAVEYGEPVCAQDSGVYIQAYKYKGGIYIAGIIDNVTPPQKGDDDDYSSQHIGNAAGNVDLIFAMLEELYTRATPASDDIDVVIDYKKLRSAIYTVTKYVCDEDEARFIMKKALPAAMRIRDIMGDASKEGAGVEVSNNTTLQPSPTNLITKIIHKHPRHNIPFKNHKLITKTIEDKLSVRTMTVDEFIDWMTAIHHEWFSANTNLSQRQYEAQAIAKLGKIEVV